VAEALPFGSGGTDLEGVYFPVSGEVMADPNGYTYPVMEETGEFMMMFPPQGDEGDAVATAYPSWMMAGPPPASELLYGGVTQPLPVAEEFVPQQVEVSAEMEQQQPQVSIATVLESKNFAALALPVSHKPPKKRK